MKNKALYTSAQETLSVKSDDNPFSRGEIAMQIHAPMASKQQLLGQSSAKLGVVTMPINPENPEISPFISLDDMYAIHTFSDHKELAWKVLDYMISSEMAKMNAQNFVSVASLPIRNADINKVGEWDAEPYKMLKPAMNAGWSFSNVYRAKWSENMKEEISNAMTNAVKDIVKDIVKDKKSVEEVLASMQKELQEKLNAERRKENK